MATFNPEQLNKKLTEAVVRVLETQNRLGIETMLNLQADMLDRVFYKGIDADGNSIGKYSKKPLYVSISGQTSQQRSSSLRPRGKDSNSPKFKNGNTRKSQYFADGYFGFRSVVGRQNQKVDLKLTGSLQGSIQVGESNNITTLAFNNDTQFEKAKGNEKRFNKVIFSASESELKAIEDVWEKEVTNAFYSSFE